MTDTNIFISVDWDFFLWRGSEAADRHLLIHPGTDREEDINPIWLFDWGHSEHHGEHLQNILWLTRWATFIRRGLDPRRVAGIRYEVGCTLPPVFHEVIRSRFTGLRHLYVADSHAMGLLALSEAAMMNGGPLHVIHFDAHSDLGYDQIERQRKNGYADCGSWLYWAMKQGVAKTAHIVYPDWVDGHDMEQSSRAEHIQALGNRVEFTTWSEWLAKGEPFHQHDGPLPLFAAMVARSSAWTPPWFDEDFIDFMECWPKEAFCLDCEHSHSKVGEHDGCTPREWQEPQQDILDQLHPPAPIHQQRG